MSTYTKFVVGLWTNRTRGWSRFLASRTTNTGADVSAQCLRSHSWCLIASSVFESAYEQRARVLPRRGGKSSSENHMQGGFGAAAQNLAVHCKAQNRCPLQTKRVVTTAEPLIQGLWLREIEITTGQQCHDSGRFSVRNSLDSCTPLQTLVAEFETCVHAHSRGEPG